jgi:hypothetical protein
VVLALVAGHMTHTHHAAFGTTFDQFIPIRL